MQNWPLSSIDKLSEITTHLFLDSQQKAHIVVHQVPAVQAVCEQQRWEGLKFYSRSCDSTRAHRCNFLESFALVCLASRRRAVPSGKRSIRL